MSSLTQKMILQINYKKWKYRNLKDLPIENIN
jgi:hypothetical protein